MGMLKLLPEVVCAVELLRVVALVKLVRSRQVLEPAIPIRLGEV
jgi:hypothetical protein